MIRAIADTHAVLWYLFADERLSGRARAAMDDAPAHGDTIGISSITFVEVVYLAEKGRIDAGTFGGLLAERRRSEPTFVEVPVDWRVGEAMQRVPRSEEPYMPDRIIAAPAVAFDVPVVSRDGKIKLSIVPTIW